MHESRTTFHRSAEGFSLIELMIAMTITLIIMGLASALLARSFNVRAREDRRAEAIADVQRALNIMTREIANAGYKLPPDCAFTSGGTTYLEPPNGIVAANSGARSIRIISNPIAPTSNPTPVTCEEVKDKDEDVQFLWHEETNGTPADPSDDSFYLMRHDNNVALTTTTRPNTVLANRIDKVNIYYFDRKVDYTTNTAVNDYGITLAPNYSGLTPLSASDPVQAARIKFIVISVGVRLPPVGTFGTEGYQPESRVQVVSDVLLRNAETRDY